jgi:cyclohexyl-isocyanide hydratase
MSLLCVLARWCSGPRDCFAAITAGIDFALAVVAEVHGRAAAEEIQLMIEYDPAPPFAGGSPKTAPAHVVESVINARRRVQSARRTIAARASARLTSDPISG